MITKQHCVHTQRTTQDFHHEILCRKYLLRVLLSHETRLKFL